MRPTMLEMLADDAGQSILEYALIVSLVSVAAVSALHFRGNKTNNTLFSNITNAMGP